MDVYYNYKQNKYDYITIFLWFLLLGMVARVTVLLRQRAIGSFASVDKYAFLQILIVLVIISLLILSFNRISKVFVKCKENSVVYLLIFYFFCSISAIWSAYPLYSLYKGLEFCSVILAIFICIDYQKNFESSEKIVLSISSIVIFLTILGHIKLIGFSFSLWHWHTNSYSASAAMVFCYCAGEYFRAEKKRKKFLLYFGLFSFTFLALGTSSASNLSAAFGIFVILIFYSKAMIGILFLLFFITFFLLIKPFQGELSFIYPVLFPGKTPMEIESLRGRIYLWQHAFMIFKMNPLFGQGFGVVTSQTENLIASHLHNSIVGALVGTGIFGTFFFMLYIIRLGLEIVSTIFRKLPGAIGCAGALTAGIINSLAMPLIGDKWEESSVVFLCFNVLLVLFVVVPYKKIRKTPKEKELLDYSNKRINYS